MNQYINDLCNFLDNSPVNFWAVESARQRLEAANFTELHRCDSWHLTPGSRHYVVVNNTAIFAFIVGSAKPSPFHIIAAHSDSPCFRLKPNGVIAREGGVTSLNTEVYGGPILYTWFDRPLSLAGQVIVRTDNPLEPKSIRVKFDQPLLTIPHLAIHFNRSVNEGNPLSKQKDMLPIIGIDGKAPKDFLLPLLAQKCDVDASDIIDFDLSLYCTEKAQTLGLDNEMIQSGRLDDLSMVHAAITALIEEADQQTEATRIVAIFDNEETGSQTKQGAGSPSLEYILRRISASQNFGDEDFMRSVAKSFMISADNAHGFHPNYATKYDPTNHPRLGGGPCIKINANCKYMTDADSSAVFIELCRLADVPYQYFVNHSDVAGGSTLGNILTSQIPLRGVDMGAPLWAMHSCRETASTADHIYTISVFRQFFHI